MLATVLGKLSVDHVIVDGKAGPTRESRAIDVQARTREIYEQVGQVDEVLADSTRAGAVSPGFGTRTFATVPFGMLGATFTKYPYIAMYEQGKNERMLVRAAADSAQVAALPSHRTP